MVIMMVNNYNWVGDWANPSEKSSGLLLFMIKSWVLAMK